MLQWLKLPAWKVAGSKPTLTFKFQGNKMFLPLSLVNIQYCGEPPRPKSSVPDIRSPGLEFRIMWWRAVSSYSSHHPQEVLVAQLSLYVQRWLKTPCNSIKRGDRPYASESNVCRCQILTHKVEPPHWKTIFFRMVVAHNIGIQTKREELTETFMMTSNWKQPFGLHGIYRNISLL